MRAPQRERSLASSLVALTALLAGSLLAACGDDVAYGDGGGEEGYDDSSGSGAPAPIAPPPDDQDPDAGPPACDSLDATQPVVLYLSADDSNSMASPAEAREAIRAGQQPQSVRTYEFLNYYDIDLPAPAFPELALFADAAPAPEEGAFDLMLAVRSHDAPAIRRPMTVTLVVDTSGSMGGAPIDRARAAIVAIAGQLQDGDIVNLLTWDTENLVVLDGHVVDGPSDPTVILAAERLEADGATDLDAGLRAGYELAEASWGADRLNRVVMISDGGANVGETTASIIGQASDDADREGIYLVGVGTGPLGSYTDDLMDIVTDMGRGAYVYLDTVAEAEVMFGDRFDETMEVAARDVRVEVTLPWYFQMLRFYGEEYSEDPEEVEPQHLAPGDTTVILQTIRACDASVVDAADAVKLKVTWQTPLARQARETVLETTVGALLAQDHGRLEEARTIVAFAEALKTGDAVDLEGALGRIESLPTEGQAALAEIRELLVAHPSMR
jgi:Ca-activated chloride channel family protein